MPKLPVTLPAPTSVQTSGRIRTPIGSVLTRSAQPLEQTLDRAQNQIQQNTARATAQSRAGILGGANLLTGLSFVNGVAQTVNTGLRGPMQGFIVSNPRALTSGVVELTNASPLTQATGTLLVQPGGSFVCDLLVF